MVELDLIRVQLPVVKGIRGIAQLVEQATDNRQVRGSIPLPTTKAGPVRVDECYRQVSHLWVQKTPHALYMRVPSTVGLGRKQDATQLGVGRSNGP